MERIIELTHAERRALIGALEFADRFTLDGDLVILRPTTAGQFVPVLRFRPVRELSTSDGGTECET